MKCCREYKRRGGEELNCKYLKMSFQLSGISGRRRAVALTNGTTMKGKGKVQTRKMITGLLRSVNLNFNLWHWLRILRLALTLTLYIILVPFLFSHSLTHKLASQSLASFVLWHLTSFLERNKKEETIWISNKIKTNLSLPYTDLRQ